MIPYFNGLNYLLRVAPQNTYQSANQVKAENTTGVQRQDYYMKTNVSLTPESCSNQNEEAISQAEYEKYCGIATLPDGTDLYFPPQSAPYAVKKAWIDGLKQLEIEGKESEIPGLKWSVIHQMREQNGLSIEDFTSLARAFTSFSASASSCQDLLIELLDEQKEMLRQGNSSGMYPERFRKQQEGHINTLQTMINSFAKIK